MRFVTLSRPSSFETVRVTSLTTPDIGAGTGVSVGDRSLEVMPSGNCHSQAVGSPDDVSVKCTARAGQDVGPAFS